MARKSRMTAYAQGIKALEKMDAKGKAREATSVMERLAKMKNQKKVLEAQVARIYPEIQV